MAPPPETRPLPAWRTELNEKIKAIRASRGGTSAAVEAAVEELATPPEADPLIIRREEIPISHGRNAAFQNVVERADSGQPSAAATAARRSSNTIVEAALVRVKRAAENASRAALPKIEPRPLPSRAASLLIDREATARALEPATEIERTVDVTPAPVPEAIQPVISKPSTVAPPITGVETFEATLATPAVVTRPVAPVATQSAAPTVANPVVPTVTRTAAPAASDPVVPKVTRSVAPTVANPVVPAVTRSVAPAVANPVVPTVTLSAAPTAANPVAQMVTQSAAPAVANRVAPTVAQTVAPAVTHQVVPSVPHTVAPAIAHTIATETASVSFQQEMIDESAFPPIDDLEPLDYLEAEIRKVDKVLAAEFKRNESPSVITHAVIGLVDLIALAVSSSPFLALVRISDVSFSLSKTRLASGIIVGFIAFFYLALTQCLCGKTFGMMLTNTRIVDATEYKTPSISQSLVRTGGYFIAAVPALIGFLWAAINRKHRGWHDYVSGTVVVRDF
ncbi:MAG TPA: RDD family protein [Blastocatellia bacterium]|nr:RDD family protein [Blastocatellia bacterium]